MLSYLAISLMLTIISILQHSALGQNNFDNSTLTIEIVDDGSTSGIIVIAVYATSYDDLYDYVSSNVDENATDYLISDVIFQDFTLESIPHVEIRVCSESFDDMARSDTLDVNIFNTDILDIIANYLALNLEIDLEDIAIRFNRFSDCESSGIFDTTSGLNLPTGTIDLPTGTIDPTGTLDQMGGPPPQGGPPRRRLLTGDSSNSNATYLLGEANVIFNTSLTLDGSANLNLTAVVIDARGVNPSALCDGDYLVAIDNFPAAQYTDVHIRLCRATFNAILESSCGNSERLFVVGADDIETVENTLHILNAECFVYLEDDCAAMLDYITDESVMYPLVTVAEDSVHYGKDRGLACNLSDSVTGPPTILSTLSPTSPSTGSPTVPTAPTITSSAFGKCSGLAFFILLVIVGCNVFYVL